MKCPDSIEELDELVKMIPLCRSELYEQAQAKIKAGEAQGVKGAAKQLAEELDVKPDTVHKAIKREKKAREGGDTVPPPQCGIDVPEQQEQIKEDSDNLFQLKLYWQRATKKDRKAFLGWTKNTFK